MNDVFLNIMPKNKENYLLFFLVFFVLHVLHHLINGCLMLVMTHLPWLLTSSMFHAWPTHMNVGIFEVSNTTSANDGKPSKSLVRMIWFT